VTVYNDVVVASRLNWLDLVGQNEDCLLSQQYVGQKLSKLAGVSML